MTTTQHTLPNRGPRHWGPFFFYRTPCQSGAHQLDYTMDIQLTPAREHTMTEQTKVARWYINNFPFGASKEAKRAHWEEYVARFNREGA